MTKSRFVLAALSLYMVGLSPASASGQTVQVTLAGKSIEGRPLFWKDGVVALIGRDGQLFTFAPDEAQSYRKVSQDFRSHTQAALRGELLREFGRNFDVTGTGQFLVVHPAGQRDRWAGRFQQLYASMQHYLVARGFRTHRPEFPLVAIVFPSQPQYLQYAASQGLRISGTTLGYYDPNSNRIQMFDITANRPDSDQWYVNADTIIHEAAHQTAFNVGIHNRFNETPRWVVEGLGTLFEAQGVWDAHHFPELSARLNRQQLELFRAAVTSNNSLDILNLQLSSDRLFQRDATLAYAHAWALTFYLTEQAPRKYAQYLELTNQRPALKKYSAQERLRDFTRIFGGNLPLFDAQFQRFMATL